MTTRADLLLKANRTIDLHARCVHMYEAGRYVGRPVTDTLTSAQFSERFGWHAERMAQDVETAMKHGCAYCGAAYASQADVSFDVIDQAIAWDYSTNVVLCCRRCNSSKGEHSVARWIADRPVLSWAVLDLRRQFAGGDLAEQLSLFDRGLAGASPELAKTRLGRPRANRCVGRDGRVAIEFDDDTIWLGGDAVTCIEGSLKI